MSGINLSSEDGAVTKINKNLNLGSIYFLVTSKFLMTDLTKTSSINFTVFISAFISMIISQLL